MNQTNKISYKDIRLTRHAKQRAEERLGITNNRDIQRLALEARYKGINLRNIDYSNFSEAGLSKEIYSQIRREFHYHSNSERFYYYKDIIFIFFGYKARVLKTIVRLDRKTYNDDINNISLEKGMLLNGKQENNSEVL